VKKSATSKAAWHQFVLAVAVALTRDRLARKSSPLRAYQDHRNIELINESGMEPRKPSLAREIP
jgi:hypothetical protein